MRPKRKTPRFLANSNQPDLPTPLHAPVHGRDFVARHQSRLSYRPLRWRHDTGRPRELGRVSHISRVPICAGMLCLWSLKLGSAERLATHVFWRKSRASLFRGYGFTPAMQRPTARMALVIMATKSVPGYSVALTRAESMARAGVDGKSISPLVPGLCESPPSACLPCLTLGEIPHS